MELENEPDMQVPESSQFLVLLLEGLLAIEYHQSVVGFVNGSQNMQQGALARSASSHYGHNLTLVHFKVQAFQHMQVPV